MTAPAWATEHLPKDPYKYQSGWGNEFATEALPNTLPIGQNSPQVCVIIIARFVHLAAGVPSWPLR